MRVIFTLFLFIGFFSCRKHEGYADSNPYAGLPSKDSFYFKAKLNGISVQWVVPAQKNDPAFIYHGGASLGYSDLSAQCIEGYCYYLSAFTQIFRNVAEVRPQMNVGFNMATQRNGRAEILSWFSPGAKNYQLDKRISTNSDLLNPSKNGIVIYYMDQDGKSWCTNNGSQPVSSFESVSLTDLSSINLKFHKVWKATFKCKLYDAAGNSINVENGEIYGPIILP